MFPVLFIAFVIDILHGNEASVGIIRGAAAAGGLAASVLVGRNARNVDPARLMMWGLIGLGAVAFLFVNITAVSTALWLFLVIFAVSGLPNMTSQIGAVGAIQRLCPPALLGRFQGLASALGSVGAVIGSIVVGLLLDRVGVTLLFNVQATLFVLSGVASYVFVIRRQPVDTQRQFETRF
jgi:MFS family permease